jgi:hypothetical protein
MNFEHCGEMYTFKVTVILYHLNTINCSWKSLYGRVSSEADVVTSETLCFCLWPQDPPEIFVYLYLQSGGLPCN